MRRRVLSPVVLGIAVLVISAGEPSAHPQVKPNPQKPDGKKKADDKKKAEPPKPKPPEPKPPTPKPVDPEPEEYLDTTKPTSPLDLARGLREQGMADLAIEYLTALESQPLSAELKTLLPLEIAKARLDAIPLEPEEGKRAAMLTRAKSEFDLFLRTHARHDRAPETALSLARVSAVLARNQLNRATAAENKDRRESEIRKTRPAFDEAARRYADATKQIADQLATGKVEGVRKFELTRDLHRAELEHGIVLFQKADTVPADTAADKKARGGLIESAKSRFKTLADRDPNLAIGWAARAWAAECDFTVQNTTEADRQTTMIRAAVNTNPAAREGVRMSKYFEVQHKYKEAKTATELRAAKEQGERWLVEFKNPLRATPEQYSVQYYVAVLKVEEAKAVGVKQDEKTKQVTVSPAAQRLLREAEKEFRALSNSNNDYADRAARQRTLAVRLIIGDAAKKPEAYPTFDECQMAALVQIDQGLREGTPDEKTKRMAVAVALLDRALQLAGPTTAPRDKLDAQVQQVFACLAGGEYARAATLGGQIARSSKSTGPAARAGAFAVQAFLQTPAEGAAADENRVKALDLTKYLEATFPDAPATDSARVMAGDVHLKQQQPEAAYAVLSRVGSGYPDLARARLLQGVAAFWLVGDKSPLPDKEKSRIYSAVTGDMAAVTTPSKDAGLDEARTFLRLHQQLASLHLVAEKPDAALAVTAGIPGLADDFANLPDPIRRVHQFEAERLRLMAVVAKAKPLADAQKYPAVTDILDPVLTAVARSVSSAGPAAKQAADLAAKVGADGKPFYDEGDLGELTAAADKLDRYRRDGLVVFALQTRIRGGQVDQAADLVGLLKRLGGNLEANAQTLGLLARTVREQTADLRKKGKAAEADKLAAGVGSLFEKIAAEPNQSPAMQVLIGITLKDLGRYDRAAELFGKIPPVAEADLKAPFASLSEEKKTAVRLFRSSRLELVRAHRLAGRFDTADEVLRAATGTDKAPGWARGSLEFRREANLILEGRAANEGDAKKKSEYWGRAKQGWDRLANEYAATLQAVQRQPLPADDPVKENEEKKKRDQMKSVYFDLFADALRCVVRGNSDLLKEKPEALAPRLAKVAEQMLAVETKNANLDPTVAAKFAEMLVESPELKAQYEKAGGKAFLASPNGR